MAPPPPPAEHPVNLAYKEYLDHFVRIPPIGLVGIIRDTFIFGGFVALVIFFRFNPTQRDTILIVLLTFHLIQVILRRRKLYAIHIERATKWIAVPTYIVMGNTMLFKRSTHSHLPCLVLFTFDEDYGLNMAYMESLADRLYGLRESPQMEPQFESYTDYVSDTPAIKNRRRELGKDFTGGPLVYVCDLIVARSMLYRGRIQQRWLPCVVEDGEEGQIELVPWQALEIMNRRLQIASKHQS